MLTTDAMSPSFLRINASSVGQSICMMRIAVCMPPVTAAGAARPLTRIGAEG